VGYNPVYLTFDELRSSIRTDVPREVNIPGKIYIYDNYLLVNEFGKGIHIIDNTNPSAPIALKFLNIPGNVDMAIRNNILFADSYIDLVAIDITNLLNPEEVNRVENAFPNANISFDIDFAINPNANAVFIAPSLGGYNNNKGILIGLEETTIKREIEGDCATPNMYLWNNDDLVFRLESANVSFSASDNFSPSANVGQGGSMARFTSTQDFLYTVNSYSLQLFDISNTQNLKVGNRIDLGWGIETIFPYKNMLFIGSQTGMHIYDNSNPANPNHLSTYQHIQSCDPVVVQGDLAYVTLRTGNICREGVNQLDVVNIADPTNPQLVSEFRMQNPHGLGIDGEDLFICEGAFGLKRFNAANPLAIDKNLVEHKRGMDAFDVIPFNDVLIMVGKDGIYQYSYENPNAMELLSTIPILKKED